MSKKKNPNRGSTFDDFLKQEGTQEETTSLAKKRAWAWLAQIVKKPS